MGAVLFGGLLFVALDQLIGQGGGYLRKTAYIISKSAVERKKFLEKFFPIYQEYQFFKSVPPQDIQAIIVRLKPRLFQVEKEFFPEATHCRVYVYCSLW